MNEETLNKLHVVLYEILEETINVIEKNNLRYYLCEGSLLGAVRHKEIIPWDDDVDICMPREDYEKFLKIANSELSSGYYIQSGSNDKDYWLPFAKVRKKNTAYYEQTWIELKNKKNQQIYIDIFPLDYADKFIFLRKIRKYFLERATALCFMKICKCKDKPFRYYLSKPLTVNMLKLIQNICMKKIISTDMYINLSSAYSVEKETFLISDFEPYSECEFSQLNCRVPHNFIKITKTIYGNDYLILPPPEKRRTHTPYRLSFDLNKPDENLD